MTRKNWAIAVLGIVVCGAFALGLTRLFLWRFEVGDVYPPYSSFRTDPLGSRALYEAVNRLYGRRATRFVDPLEPLPEGDEHCLLVLGLEPKMLVTHDDTNQLDGFLAEGGRVVIALAPTGRTRRIVRDKEKACDDGGCSNSGPTDETDENTAHGDGEDDGVNGAAPSPPGEPPSSASEEGEREAGAEGAPTADDGSDGEARNETGEDTPAPKPGVPLDRERDVVQLGTHWGFRMVPGAIAREGSSWPQASRSDAFKRLPEQLSWHASSAIEPRHDSWRTVYAVGEDAVVLERPRGHGTIVLITDAYYLSNEAMRSALEPALLSWILGPSRRIVFDETHFGIARRKGLVGLARSYGLEGFLLSVLALGGLFVWQKSARFLPPPETPRPAHAAQGRAADAALRDLLRQHIKRKALLPQCVAAWRRTAPLPQRSVPQKAARLDAAAGTGRTDDIVHTYDRMVEIAQKRDSQR